MNELLDAIALWIYREPRAVAYLVICMLAILQTYALCGR